MRSNIHVFLGDPVVAGDEVVLTAAGNTQQCLHASDLCLSDNEGSHEVILFKLSCFKSLDLCIVTFVLAYKSMFLSQVKPTFLLSPVHV